MKPWEPLIAVQVIAPALVAWGWVHGLKSEVSSVVLWEPESAESSNRVVVWDADMPSGLETLRTLAADSHVKVLAVSSAIDPSWVDALVWAGACGVLAKSEPPETLIKAIQCVYAGQVWLDRGAAGRILQSLRQPAPRDGADAVARLLANLTPKERQVVAVVADATDGQTRALAISLRISEHTLRNHLSSIYSKLGLINRIELFAWARRHRDRLLAV